MVILELQLIIQLKKLHIWGNSATTALSIGDNSLTEPYVLLEADATDNVSTLHSRGNHPLTFEIQQSEKVRIQNDGKVGIGTNSPTDFLSIYGAQYRYGIVVQIIEFGVQEPQMVMD